MYVVRGLRQAMLMLVAGGLVGLAVAGLWTLWHGGDLRRATGLTLIVLAGLLSLTGGSVASRAETYEINAFLGRGPDREEPATGSSLTAVGVFLFVAVPLFLVGGLLYGAG